MGKITKCKTCGKEIKCGAHHGKHHCCMKHIIFAGVIACLVLATKTCGHSCEDYSKCGTETKTED
jgi:hypothetical protein